jgi:hypothetical protein
MYSMRLPQKDSPSHGKPSGAYYPLSGVELRLSRPVVSPFYIVVPVQDTYNHSSRSKAFVFHVKISRLHPQSEFPMREHCWFISGITASILTWTYHAFDKPKVVFMGDGYDILG